MFAVFFGRAAIKQRYGGVMTKRVSSYLYIIPFLCALCTFSSALADWDPGDEHKMHYPQLPDPTGWDVYAEYPVGLADDWTCSESGELRRIHFWGSWLQDDIGEIGDIMVRIYDNDTSGAFNKPGNALWTYIFSPDEYTARLYSDGTEQGWYFPNLDGFPGAYNENDHTQIWQYNIPVLPEPFYQEEGNTYWLGVGVDFSGDSAYWGWKTTQDAFQSGAVFWSGFTNQWTELHDPVTGEALELSFVVQHLPEPATICLFSLGAVALLGRRKR